LTCDNKPLSNKSISVRNLKTNQEQQILTDDKGRILLSPLMNSIYRFEYNGEGNLESCSAEKTFNSEGKTLVTLTSKYKSNTVKFTVVDENGEPLEGAQLTYYSGGSSIKKVITEKDNAIIQLSPQEIAEIDSIVANKINYYDGRLIWSKNEDCKVDKILTLSIQKRTDSEFIKLENIYYDFDLWNLRPEGKVELDKLVRYMQEHPDLIVELGSHTDSRGSDSYNVRLAERRSNSCVSYIKSNGIPNENIIAKGYGEKQLVNNCSNDVKCSKEDHQLNRRTELKIKLD
jgi:outer membrane protein OmpA-like peptidoglycan-associated protein